MAEDALGELSLDSVECMANLNPVDFNQEHTNKATVSASARGCAQARTLLTRALRLWGVS